MARQRQDFEAALLAARQRAEEAQRLQADGERFTRAVADLIPSMVAFWGRDLRRRCANAAMSAANRTGCGGVRML